MRFDVPSLFSLLLILSLTLAVLLPAVVGGQGGRGARLAQLSAALQAAGWAALLLPEPAQPLPATVALGLLSASLTALWLACAQWLPGRRGRWLQLALPVVVMAGYAATWNAPPLRLAWSNGWLGLQMLALVASLLLPVKRGPHGHRRWRLLLAGSLTLLGVTNLGRAALAGLASDALPAFDAPHPLNIAFAVMANLGVLAVALSVLAAWRGETEAELRRLAQIDAATGLANHRAFQQRSVDMVSMARRYEESLMLVVMDLDGLKAINAAHGEAQGDAAIALFAACLDEHKRLGDLVARLDGQRFGVLMVRSDLVGPPALDRRVREALQARAPTTLGFALSYSAGWAKLRPGDRHVDDLLRRAESALYAAKRQGRGRMSAEPGLEAELSVAGGV